MYREETAEKRMESFATEGAEGVYLPNTTAQPYPYFAVTEPYTWPSKAKKKLIVSLSAISILKFAMKNGSSLRPGTAMVYLLSGTDLRSCEVWPRCKRHSVIGCVTLLGNPS